MTPPPGGDNPPVPTPPIVCFSHLGWDAGLFQRPQQIMSRLAARGHPVYYFACVGHHRHRETPHNGPVAGSPGVNVYTIPYAPGVRKFAGLRKWLAAQKIARVLGRNKVRTPVLWFYHPSLFALGYSHQDAAIVYDVMDHFPSFENVVDDIYFDELMMLAETDVVFTGGRALQRHTLEMLAALHNDTRVATGGHAAQKMLETPAHPVCLPSGVDLPHFAQALVPDATHHPAVAELPGPILGYFGAIDERIDWDIICLLAKRTRGSVVLAGPVLRPPPQLPENVHLPGAISYGQLPGLLAGFDVCLIPFRNTDLVQFVSPTKTPEYLAGGKPVVSTPIPDVVAGYGEVVAIADTPEKFTEACERLIAAPPEPEKLSAEAAARAHTWDQIAERMAETVAAHMQRQNPAAEHPA